MRFKVSGGPIPPPVSLLGLGTSNAPPFNGGISVVMPNAPCLRFYAQYFVFPNLQIQSTNYGRVLIGG